jgi:hypothetical protein
MMGEVVQYVEDGLPDDPLLLLALVVLELDRIHELIGFRFLHEGDVQGVDLLHQGGELGEVLSDLGLQIIDLPIEDDGLQRIMASEGLVSLEPGDLVPEAMLDGPEDRLVEVPVSLAAVSTPAFSIVSIKFRLAPRLYLARARITSFMAPPSGIPVIE